MNDLASAMRTPQPTEPSLPKQWELVVGLEVHVELNTVTKLFCGCLNRFGAEPNTNICPTCLGLPGSLPVINEHAVNLAMTIGRALGCRVNRSVMARKNYFYPDMPKNFQTSQYDQPTNSGGQLVLADGYVVGIERAHIEEDTGKSTHIGRSGRITEALYSLIDYNRAGVPLVEIVSKPDIRTVDQARGYVEELRAVLVTTGVSDARMEEGSIRVDANVSVRPKGSAELRTRCEIKNINSLRSLGKAISYEANRHVQLCEAGEAPQQQTRHWDENAMRTTLGRSKEDADDYRYFQEPDLLPLEPTSTIIDSIDAAMPTLPATRRANLTKIIGGDQAAARVLVERGQDNLALAAVKVGADPQKVVNRLINDVAGQDWHNLEPHALASVVKMETNGELSASQAKQILADLITLGGNPKDHVARRGFETVDLSALNTLLSELMVSNPSEWQRFVEGDKSERKKMQGFFTGQIMKATRGRADGKLVAQLLNEKITPTTK